MINFNITIKEEVLFKAWIKSVYTPKNASIIHEFNKAYTSNYILSMARRDVSIIVNWFFIGFVYL